MTELLKTLLWALVGAAAALAIVASFTPLHALELSVPGAGQQEAPKDCKAKPDDPRCKDAPKK